MRKLLLVLSLLAGLLAAGLAVAADHPLVVAQVGSPHWGAVIHHRSTSYQGPIDVGGAASLYYGMRAGSASWASSGGNAIVLCGPSDSWCDTEVVNSSGNLALDANGLTCNNSGTICTVKELYDQSGNGCNLTQSTIADRATFVLDAEGSLPGMGFTHGTTLYTGSCSWISGATTWMEFVQVQTQPNTSGCGNSSCWFTDYGNPSSHQKLFNGIQSTAVMNVGFYAANKVTTVGVTAPASLMFGYDGTNSTAAADGGSIYSVSNSGQNISSTTLNIGQDDNGVATYDAGEFIFFPSYSSTAAGNVAANMMGYW